MGELLTFVVAPAIVAVLAASANRTRDLFFWAIPLCLVATAVLVSLVSLSTASAFDRKQDLAVALVFFGLPTVAAFTLAPRARFRKRRGLAVIAATVTYVVTEFACLIAAVNLGLLKP